MRHPYRTIGLLVLALALAQPAIAQRRKAAAPVENGEMLSQSCFACHGVRGASGAAPMPIIGGQPEDYLRNNLQSFKDAIRPATVMTRLMRGYSDAEIAAIAKYFSEQPFLRAEQPVDSGKVEMGMKVYQRVCKDCHLRGGREPSEAEYPVVAGQWLPYMQMTMVDIVSGARIVDEKFQAALGKVTRDELEAVLHYFAAQR